MKKLNSLILFFILFIADLFWQVAPAQSQSTMQVTSVQVGLFPEYDRPIMLVVLDIDLSMDSTNPQMLTFQVPADAESLSVLQRTGNGTPIPLEAEVEEIGKWKDVRFLTDAQTIQIEYYDPNLVKEGDHRFYAYQWLSTYNVDSLSIIVRQPFGAGEIQADPPLDGRETGPDDAAYYTQAMGAVPAGELFTLTLIYTKDTANLAYPALPVEPAQPVSDATPGRTPSPLSVIMWLLTVAVAVLVLVGLYYWWFKSNVMDKRDRTVQGVGIMNPEKQAVFCHECGMRSRPGDSFCSNCGTELRRPAQKNQRSKF